MKRSQQKLAEIRKEIIIWSGHLEEEVEIPPELLQRAKQIVYDFFLENPAIQIHARTMLLVCSYFLLSKSGRHAHGKYALVAKFGCSRTWFRKRYLYYLTLLGLSEPVANVPISQELPLRL